MSGAASFVRETLLAVLPLGAPPSFAKIRSARWVGSGRNAIAVGQLTMFDGAPATVECRQVGLCRSHHFTELPGGAISWEGDQWARCTDDGELLAPLPLFERASPDAPAHSKGAPE